MYILGGPPNAMASTQMLVLNECILQRVGTLNYPMNGCLGAVYLVETKGPFDQTIITETPIVCASAEDPKGCYGFDPLDKKEKWLDKNAFPNDFQESHYGGAMTVYKGTPFVVGGRTTLVAEHMIYFINGTNAWSPTLPMPGVQKRAFLSAVSFDNKVTFEFNVNFKT